MKCVVSGGNIKILAKAIQMLSKIGDEMFVHPQEDCLCFKSVNGSNSAFIDVTFHENYFSYYAYEDLEESDALKCKILIRSALAVFKTPSLLDKQVESCHIQLEANSEELCFILKYRNSIIKTYLLPILDCETIKANYQKGGTANHLCIQPRVMSDVVQNFQQGLLEITIEVLSEKALIRNYIDETSNISNETRTQLVFSAGEFDQYAIESDTTITFCLKELRAILNFAETLSQPINIYFDQAGRPVVFVCKSGSLETNLVLATLNPDTDAMSQSTASTKTNPLPKKTSNKRVTKSTRGIQSFNKKLADTTKVNNTRNNSINTEEIKNIESVGRVSNISETLSENNKRNTRNSAAVLNTSTSSKSTTRKEDESSIEKKSFPLLMKRKSDDQISRSNFSDNDDLVQNSPPRHRSKKAKLIFQKCFQTTFDPRLLPGHNDVEVENSSESD